MSSSEEEAAAERIATLEDLREKLRNSEIRADKFAKETEVLQSRLQDSLAEQAKLEDRLHEDTERIEALQNAKAGYERQMREMERIYEGERAAMNKEKEEMAHREEEMQSIIQRLKESLSSKSNGDDGDLQRPDSRNFRHCTWRFRNWLRPYANTV